MPGNPEIAVAGLRGASLLCVALFSRWRRPARSSEDAVLGRIRWRLPCSHRGLASAFQGSTAVSAESGFWCLPVVRLQRRSFHSAFELNCRFDGGRHTKPALIMSFGGSLHFASIGQDLRVLECLLFAQSRGRH